MFQFQIMRDTESVHHKVVEDCNRNTEMIGVLCKCHRVDKINLRPIKTET